MPGGEHIFVRCVGSLDLFECFHERGSRAEYHEGLDAIATRGFL